MRRQRFEQLNRRHGLRDWTFFRQRWLKKHLGEAPGICAALIRFWWQERIHGRDPFLKLGNLKAKHIEQLRKLQEDSLYMAHLPAHDAELSDIDRALLQAKYGASTVAAARDVLARSAAGSFLELGIQHEFAGTVAARFACGKSCHALAAALASGTSTLRLLVLRYLRASAGGCHETGHRTIAWKTPDDRCFYFDPNCGETVFEDVERFREWFADYWREAGLHARTDPTEGLPFARVFHVNPSQ